MIEPAPISPVRAVRQVRQFWGTENGLDSLVDSAKASTIQGGMRVADHHDHPMGYLLLPLPLLPPLVLAASLFSFFACVGPGFPLSRWGRGLGS